MAGLVPIIAIPEEVLQCGLAGFERHKYCPVLRGALVSLNPLWWRCATCLENSKAFSQQTTLQEEKLEEGNVKHI
jgi:hypothetical protein